MDVLLVDDLDSSRAVLRTVLGKTGLEIKIHEVSNGVQAMLWCSAHTPDLILLDLYMPDMDGLEFAHRIQAEERLNHVPIVMVTVEDKADIRSRAHAAGIDNVVSKPFHPRAMQALLQKLLQERQEHIKQLASTTGQMRSLAQHVLQEAEKLPEQAESGVFKDFGRRIAEAARAAKKPKSGN